MANNEEVFISYSHDSIEHMERVRSLADRLRSEGVDCDIDQYEETPPEGWPRWMGRKISDSKFVLVICTEAYFNRFEGKEVKGKGLGAVWEGGIVLNSLYELGGANMKFIPVVFDYADRHFIPTPLKATTYYNLGKSSGHEDLYRRLTGQPKVKKPALGKLRALPPREIRTSPALLIASAIDVDLWNKAKWSATFFLEQEGQSPTLGIAFRNEAQGRKIFQQWRDRYGASDEKEELRVAIIEGPIDGEEDGYSVHLTQDPDVLRSRMAELGQAEDGDIYLMVSRINRMTPADGLKNLLRFKERFNEFKEYRFAPGVVSPDGRDLKPIPELGITKRRLIFKDVSEIGQNDPDMVVLGSGHVSREKQDWAASKKSK